MMILKSLAMHNIRSYTDIKIDFPLGSTLLSGDIGSGKSTVLMAIDFALFGIRRGEISGSDILRHGRKSGYVRLGFEINGRKFVVQRNLDRKKSIGQTSGFLVVDGIEFEYMPTELTARILEILGYPMDMRKGNSIFRYAVYTPQEEMKHILLYAEDRLNILRNIFNIDKYGRIRENTGHFLSELRAMKRELEAFVKDTDLLVEEKKKKEDEASKIFFDIKHYSSLLTDIDRQIEKSRADIERMKKEIDTLMQLKQELSLKESELRAKKSRLSAIDLDISEYSSRIIEMEKTLSVHIERPHIDEQLLASDMRAFEADRDALTRQKALLSDEVKKLREVLEKKVCSFCGQPVHDAHRFAANIDSKSGQLNDIEKGIVEIKNRIEEYQLLKDKWKDYKHKMENRNTIEKHMRDMAARKARYEEERLLLEKDVNKLLHEIERIKPSLERFDDVKGIYESMESKYNELMNEKLGLAKAKSRLEQQREDIMNYIDRLADEIERKQIEKRRIENLNEIMSWLDGSFMNMMEVMEQHVMLALQYEFNTFFQSWFEIIIQNGLSVRIDENFSPVIVQNGFDTAYENLSGGEKTSVALAYRLALNKVINSISEGIKTKDMIILDEPTDGFSNDQLDRLRDVISQLKLKQIIIVSHEPKIDTFVDNVMKLYKDNHVSRIEYQ